MSKDFLIPNSDDIVTVVAKSMARENIYRVTLSEITEQLNLQGLDVSDVPY